MRRGERQRLLKVSFFQVRVVSEQFFSIRIAGKNLEHSFDGDSKPANTRLAAHLVRLDRDSVERRFQRHQSIVAWLHLESDSQAELEFAAGIYITYNANCLSERRQRCSGFSPDAVSSDDIAMVQRIERLTAETQLRAVSEKGEGAL